MSDIAWMTIPIPADVVKALNLTTDEADHVHRTLWEVLHRELRERTFPPSWTYTHSSEAESIVAAGWAALLKHPFDRAKGVKVTTWAWSYGRGRMIEQLNAVGTEMVATELKKVVVDPSDIASSELTETEVCPASEVRHERGYHFSGLRFNNPAPSLAPGVFTLDGRGGAGVDLEFDSSVLAEGLSKEGAQDGRMTRQDSITAPLPFRSGVPDPGEEDASQTARTQNLSQLQAWEVELEELRRQGFAPRGDVVLRSKPANSLRVRFADPVDPNRRWLSPLDPSGKPTAKDLAEEAKLARYERQKAYERGDWRTGNLGGLIHPEVLENLYPRAYKAFMLWWLKCLRAGKPPSEKQLNTRTRDMDRKVAAFFKQRPKKKPPSPQKILTKGRLFIRELVSLLDTATSSKKPKSKAAQ